MPGIFGNLSMSKDTSPRVTVLMTLYNKGRFVEDAVRSVLANSYKDLEILVVDDGSTDDGPERVGRVQDDRVKLLLTDRNAGRPTAANRGYNAARGEFIAVLDADDLMRPDRLARQVAFLDAHPDVGVVGSSLGVFGEQKDLWHWPETDEQAQSRILFGDPVCYGTAMMRRAIVEEHQVRCDESWLYPGMDYLFLVALSRHARFANIMEPLTQYRTGEQNMRHGRDPIEDRARTYRGLFRLLGIKADDGEVQCQLMLHRMFRHPPTKTEVRALNDWIAKLKRLNRDQQLFPVHGFEDELDRRWRNLFHPIADLSPAAAITHRSLNGRWTLADLRYLAAAALARMRKPVERSVTVEAPSRAAP